MGILSFDKQEVGQLKDNVTGIKDELNSIYTEMSTNLDLLKSSWDGKNSDNVLIDSDEIVRKNKEIITRLETNISFLADAIKIYDQAENAGVSISSVNQSLKDKYPSYFNTNMTKVTVDGVEYYVVNTAINPIDYAKHVKEKGLSQRYTNAGKCLMAAQFYAQEMMYGNKSSFNRFAELDGAPSWNFSKSVQNENIEIVKEGLYEIFKSGYPAVIKVDQTSPDKPNSRHYVTAVGFTTDITDPSQINENNILVIDPASGNLVTLAKSGKYRDRVFFAENGKYEVIGPSDDLVAKVDSKTNKKNKSEILVES